MEIGTPRVYGVVDCAIDPRLYEHVARLEPQSAACLFEGRLHPQVRAVSPYLVELSPTDPLNRLWIGEGWGRSWGILIGSQADLPVVRRRLRHFTQARLPAGEGPVLFRFWDPRVFRVYLPLVEADQLDDWFRAIDHYIAETEDGQGSICYSLQASGLKVETGPRLKV